MILEDAKVCASDSNATETVSRTNMLYNYKAYFFFNLKRIRKDRVRVKRINRRVTG